MNILDPFRRFLFTHLDFGAFPMDKCYVTVKTISSKMEVISWLPLPCPQRLHKKRRFIYEIFKIHTNNSYQPKFLFIQDNVYYDYRTIFYHFASSMNKNMKKWPQTETGSQTGAFTLL